MKGIKLYLISLVANLLPLFVASIFVGSVNGDANLIYVLYSVLFLIAAVINISFFRIDLDDLSENKVRKFFVLYSSTLFFLVIGILDCISGELLSSLASFLLFSLINFLVVVYYNHKSAKTNNK